MLNRIFYRLRYGTYSLLLLGLILVFIEGYRLWGVVAILLALVSFFVLNWLVDKTADKLDYEADENGNAKPVYR